MSDSRLWIWIFILGVIVGMAIVSIAIDFTLAFHQCYIPGWARSYGFMCP